MVTRAALEGFCFPASHLGCGYVVIDDEGGLQCWDHCPIPRALAEMYLTNSPCAQSGVSSQR